MVKQSNLKTAIECEAKLCTIVPEKPRPQAFHWQIFVMNCYVLLLQWPTYFQWRTHLSSLI